MNIPHPSCEFMHAYFRRSFGKTEKKECLPDEITPQTVDNFLWKTVSLIQPR